MKGSRCEWGVFVLCWSSPQAGIHQHWCDMTEEQSVNTDVIVGGYISSSLRRGRVCASQITVTPVNRHHCSVEWLLQRKSRPDSAACWCLMYVTSKPKSTTSLCVTPESTLFNVSCMATTRNLTLTCVCRTHRTTNNKLHLYFKSVAVSKHFVQVCYIILCNTKNVKDVVITKIIWKTRTWRDVSPD